MQAGKLNKRVKVYRTSHQEDGYGGYSESNETLTKTIWAQKKETKNQIQNLETGQRLVTDLELIVRKQTADLLVIDRDILQLENQTGRFRINAIEEYDQDFYSLVKCSRHGN